MTDLSGLGVLVVEDEGFVALAIEEMLEELGCEVRASVARLAEARTVAATADFDLAVLDVNLGGVPVFPVAYVLRDRGIPFLFSTGYGAAGLPPEFAHYLVLGKPFSVRDLERTIALTLGR